MVCLRKQAQHQTILMAFDLPFNCLLEWWMAVCGSQSRSWDSWSFMAFLPGTGGCLGLGQIHMLSRNTLHFLCSVNGRWLFIFPSCHLKEYDDTGHFIVSHVSSSSHQQSGKQWLSWEPFPLYLQHVQEERSSSVKSRPHIRSQSSFSMPLSSVEKQTRWLQW